MPVSNFSGYFPHRLAQMMAHRVKPLSWSNKNKQFNCGRDKWKLDFLRRTICSTEKSTSKSWRIKATAQPLVNPGPIFLLLKTNKKPNILIPLFPVIWPCWLLRLSCHQKDVRCTSVAFPGTTMRPCITPSLFHLVSLHAFPLTQLLPHPACQRQPSVMSLRLQAISSTSMTAYVDVHRRGIVSPLHTGARHQPTEAKAEFWNRDKRVCLN